MLQCCRVKRNVDSFNMIQRRGESWCTQPLDKTLKMPGSSIKKQDRYSAAPAQDAMKMDLGDESRAKDGWLWVVRSCGGKRQWIRTGFESSIKPKESKNVMASMLRVAS